MSIIEKAMGRFGPERKPDPGVVSRSEPAFRENLIEIAVERQYAARAAEDEPAPPPAAVPDETGARGHIDLARLRRAGMITPDGERTQLADQFREIKRPLLANAFSRGPAPVKNGNLVMITSALPGEGKSFCSVNLAMSIAMEMDHTVLLVDADVAKPAIPAMLGLETDKGLMDVLLDDRVRLPDVLIRTNVEKLVVLPAGRRHRHATELLASGAMKRLLQEMSQRYRDRIIIFDSPPLLVATEARVLASGMGQVVLVVEVERTTQDAVREAVSQIESCEVVSLLLNKGKFPTGSDYYGSYYGSYGTDD
jgi:receptor protein-tyrosine kinase